jgi:hypothetical protein
MTALKLAQPAAPTATKVLPPPASTATGPRTPQGKATSSKNATQHGLLCQMGHPDDMEGFKEHEQNLMATYAPVGTLEGLLVERIAMSLWRLRRVERYESSVVARAITRGHELVADAGLQGEVAEMAMLGQTALAGGLPDGEVARITRYEAHIERGLYRAMHELEALQDKRQGRAAPLARLEVHGTP